GVVARPLAGTIALAAAVLADEAGDAGAAGRHLAAGVKLQREGPYPFLPASVPEIAPRLLRLLAAEGHGDLVAEVRSRYPHSVPEGETGEVGGHIAPRIEIRTFGRMQVRVGGAQVAFRRRKAPVLLAHLLQNPAGLSRDEAADLLFEDLAWEEARHQVDNLMSLLRRELGKDTGALRKEAGRYWLAPDAVWWDAREFDVAYGAGNAAWERGDRDQAGVHYAAALDCYAGDLFAGSEFAEWFEPARQAYRAGAISALERCGELELAQERFESARQRAERILEREPAHEGAHRLLMRIYAKLGEAGLVRRQFDACARSLERELDTAPSGETVALRDALLARA
ncbi:MAG: hypothetical protein FJZ01_21350, partial [Candidatus Sericytochromatia bacterium]|nr:hypothetical protein [Candidatus Tanganyikabacteria bacterium]